MFKKLNIPVLGLVENMSSVNCPKCSSEVRLFGDGTDELAKEINVPILQRIPLQSELNSCCDKGVPILIQDPNHKISVVYKDLAKQILKLVDGK